jgi:(+)-trans-carveol dehydrogenase
MAGRVAGKVAFITPAIGHLRAAGRGSVIQNAATYELFASDLPEAERTKEALAPRFGELNLRPIPWVEVANISHAVLWLASDESRYVTGVTLPIDAGLLIK